MVVVCQRLCGRKTLMGAIVFWNVLVAKAVVSINGHVWSPWCAGQHRGGCAGSNCGLLGLRRCNC
jgi:hypothetical protein